MSFEDKIRNKPDEYGDGKTDVIDLWIDDNTLAANRFESIDRLITFTLWERIKRLFRKKEKIKPFDGTLWVTPDGDAYNKDGELVE